jgi:hypothetical protein
MAGIQGTNIVAPVVPLDTADVHPTHVALYGKGGYRTVATTAERDAIPSARREAGMLVFVSADSQRYRLGSDLTTWTVDAAGTTTWAGITGKPSTFAPSAHAASHASGGSDAVSLNTSQVQTGGEPGTLAALNNLVDSLNEANAWDDARANVIECADRSHTHAAGDIATGTIATARLGSGTASASTYLRGDQTWAAISTYTLPAATTSTLGGVIVGTGLGVTSGTVSVTYGTTSGTACQGNDSRLTNTRTPTDGTVTTAKIVDANVTVAKLSATGTASSSTFLRGDGAWAAAGSTSASDLTSGTLPEGRLPNLVIVHPFLLAGM